MLEGETVALGLSHCILMLVFPWKPSDATDTYAACKFGHSDCICAYCFRCFQQPEANISFLMPWHCCTLPVEVLVVSTAFPGEFHAHEL